MHVHDYIIMKPYIKGILGVIIILATCTCTVQYAVCGKLSMRSINSPKIPLMYGFIMKN